MTDGLTSWLRAQLDADEQDIRDSTGPHLPRCTPRRMRAEVDAKRSMIDLLFRHAAKIDSEWGCCHDPEQIRDGLCGETPPDSIEGLRLLALPYAERPGYRPEWAPGADD